MEVERLSSTPKPFGLKNTTNNCWLNVILQALLSCSSVNKSIAAYSNTDKFVAFYKKHLLGSQNSYGALFILNCFDVPTCTLKGKINGMNDAAEALDFLISSFVQHVKRCFMMARMNGKNCSCKKMSRETFTIEAYDDISVESIKNEINKVPLGTCDKCKMPYDKTVSRLCMAREVICIQIVQEPDRKVKRNFPEKLSFASTDGGYINYQLVAQIELLGDLQNGHYVCRVLRNGVVYWISDETIYSDHDGVPIEFCPSENTVMLMYHCCD